ncbi:MAG: DNA replication/repair protein RecF [Symbiobacterium sp.]|uniref:DNA replication/repair protein RecF n=1 Tax=Symbiobacterium sp. TaxID=1971213 RepID=UPI003463CE62
MYLASLQLDAFRNYNSLSVQFSPGLNVLYGDNAQGKTNLLEAIHFLATGRSHRTSRDQDLIMEGRPALRARAEVVRKTGSIEVELNYGLETRKQLKINGVPERKIARLVGSLAVVFFSPDDLQLLKGPPSGRRRFLDLELSQISQNYLHHLMTYNRLVNQRNTLLKQPTVDAHLLAVYDDQLVETAAQLIVRRAEAVRRLSPLAAHFHALLSDGREDLRLAYQSQGVDEEGQADLDSVAARLRRALASLQGEERRRQVTLVGPHRDDIAIWVAGRDARLYASQGQQRTAVLALKLAELQFMTEEIGEAPVLLLDDVASELDPNRRNYLLAAVQEGVQSFITCTDLEDLMARQWPAGHRLFRVQSGTVNLDERGLP